MHLLDIEKVNFDDFVGQLRDVCADFIKVLWLTNYRATTKTSLFGYFPSVTTLYAENTDPSLLYGFCQIQWYAISIEDGWTHKIDGLYEAYGKRFYNNAASLHELYIKADDDKGAQHFIDHYFITGWPVEPIPEIEVKTKKIIYITTDGNENRTLTIKGVEWLDDALRSVNNVKFDHLKIHVDGTKGVENLHRFIEHNKIEFTLELRSSSDMTMTLLNDFSTCSRDIHSFQSKKRIQMYSKKRTLMSHVIR